MDRRAALRAARVRVSAEAAVKETMLKFSLSVDCRFREICFEKLFE